MCDHFCRFNGFTVIGAGVTFDPHSDSVFKQLVSVTPPPPLPPQIRLVVRKHVLSVEGGW